MTQNPNLNKQKLLQCIEEAVSTEKKDSERILEYLKECDQLDLEVLPLDMNKSEVACTFEDERTLRISLSALISGESQFLEDIVTERQKKGDFKTFQDFCERIDPEILPGEFLSHCVEAGAFDSTGASRASLFLGYEKIIQAVQKSKADQSSNQISLFEALPASSKAQLAPMPLPDAESWTDEETIAHEKNAMGFSFTEYLSDSPPYVDEEPPLPPEELTVDDLKASFPQGAEPNKPATADLPAQERTAPGSENEPEVISESASEESKPVPSTFIIQFQTSKTTENTLIQLRKLIEQSPGDVSVMLEFIDEQNNTTSLKTHTDYSVQISEKFVKDVESITGESTTRILNEV